MPVFTESETVLLRSLYIGQQLPVFIQQLRILGFIEERKPKIDLVRADIHVHESARGEFNFASLYPATFVFLTDIVKLPQMCKIEKLAVYALKYLSDVWCDVQEISTHSQYLIHAGRSPVQVVFDQFGGKSKVTVSNIACDRG